MNINMDLAQQPQFPKNSDKIKISKEKLERLIEHVRAVELVMLTWEKQPESLVPGKSSYTGKERENKFRSSYLNQIINAAEHWLKYIETEIAPERKNEIIGNFDNIVNTMLNDIKTYQGDSSIPEGLVDETEKLVNEVLVAIKKEFGISE